ncbi:MAG: hydrolase TatD [Pelagibacteraceae bacterium]|nr:hydrolase TatD [Pelagibacteraceae bacterium]|tara:strand:+ start:15402 stop:16178 length:777 start_codon:yes stop_codon:yes gene_type:complete
MIIDSHCHLTYEPIYSSLDETIKRANDDGVKYMLTISTEDKSFNKILDITNKYKCVFGTYGIHPHEAKNHKELKCADIVNKIKKNKKIIGIGETGLDFYYNHSEKKDQISLFHEHIEASRIMNLPLVIHTRSAEEETYKILKNALIKSDLKILIHCFTGSKEFAFKLIDLGAYISASGVVTFKKSKNLAEIFKELPNEKILVETDSPYLAPEPFRGKSNQPCYIVNTVKFLSEIKKISLKDFSNQTSKNFLNLFGELS